MKNLLKILFNHERYQSISVILCIIMLTFMASCRPRCHSLIEPGKKITAEELQGEVELLNGRIQSEVKSLEQQEAIRTLLLSLAQTSLAAGSFNITSALTGAIALLGTGAFIDNTRKRKAIRTLEAVSNPADV
jgi:hypothetical protein